MTLFTEFNPTIDNYWRSIILFGRNVASYKFALGKSLLEFAAIGKDFVTLDELAEPFSKSICNHLRLSDKQGTSKSSRFLNGCRDFNDGTISKEELISKTTKLGFVNVIDAFHVVHSKEIELRFFFDERKGEKKGIRITDELFQLTETFQYRNIENEIDARWNLVETAWNLNLPRHVLTVLYDPMSHGLITFDKYHRRKSITGCRDALNGYQKGKCFYCFNNISIAPTTTDLADIDHFFPFKMNHLFRGNLDQIWNLVLACKTCNRGEKGKSDNIPEKRFLERLHKRNNFLINSHHPLRETLVKQTGNKESDRRNFLQAMYNQSRESILHHWKPVCEHEPAF